MTGLLVGGLLASACTSPGASGVCGPEGTDVSVAQLWVDAILQAVRRDLPAPTDHARNLHHATAAAYDAWAAYDAKAETVFLDTETLPSDEAARREQHGDGAQEVAVAQAMWVVARDRYADAVGGEESLVQVDELAETMCLGADPEPDTAAGTGAAAAAAALAFGAQDGADDRDRWYGPDDQPVNPPLDVGEPGTDLPFVDRWQPLQFDQMVTQNGIPLETTVQDHIGPHWGFVEPFALPDHDGDGMRIDPGPPPGPEDPAFRVGVLDVLEQASRLDPTDGELVDINPGAVGDNPLGTDDSDGHDVNPATGEPYEPNLVPRADHLRVVAEYWADGPTSETPPGHWFSIARAANAQTPPEARRIAGVGEPVDALEWDVKRNLALGGALHDAAVAAWGAKRVYDYVRPISLVRHLGGLGQSTDQNGPSHDPDGLPLSDGLVEVVTEDSSAPGARHAELAEHVGEVAVLAWARPPRFFGDDVASVRWIRAVDWLPYQMATFVTPAFPAYVSGHSTFSRAAAEVLTAFTGDAYVPGGLLEFDVPGDFLRFEDGPTAPLTLQFATYRDAADQAGFSRIPGGIHVPADDLAGRRLGAEVGELAWARAAALFEGTDIDPG